MRGICLVGLSLLICAGGAFGRGISRVPISRPPFSEAELAPFELSEDFSALGGDSALPNGPALGARTRFDWNPTNEVGWIVDFGGYRYQAPGRNSSIYTLMTGPKWTLTHDRHFTFYLDFLIGQALIGPKLAQARNSKWRGIGMLGGGFDFPITSRSSFRMIELQIGAIGSRSTLLGAGRISSGVVFRFGGK